MNGQLIRITTEDGLELQGLFCPAKDRSTSAILHVHGLAGNFYENRFIDAIAERAKTIGCHFLTINNRGHDYISDFLRKNGDGYTWAQIGGAHEIFEECLLDLKAWIAFLNERGVRDILLEGHSSGALKAVYTQSTLQDKRIKGLILMSPSDDYGLQVQALGNKFEQALQVAKKLIKSGKPTTLMPKQYFSYPIDARTYLNMFGEGNKNGIFNFSNQRRRSFKELASIRCPILALLGTRNEAIIGEPAQFLERFKATASSSVRCDTHIIDGAPHNYLTHEARVAQIIGDWAETVLPAYKGKAQ